MVLLVFLRAQSGFDVHVDVFQGNTEGELALLNFLADISQALLKPLALVAARGADFRQHFCVHRRPADVMRIKLAVEAHAFGKLLDAAIGRLLKYTARRFFGHVTA